MKKIPLTRGMFALVDDEDYEWLSQWKWCAQVRRRGKFCAARRGDAGGTVYMHRAITEAPKNLVVDHVDHDQLNNQRANLRVCTVAQNAWNKEHMPYRSTSGYKGVHYRPNHKNKWMAKLNVTIDGKRKQVYLGSYATPEEAAKAYDKGARQYFGEYALMNF